MRRRTHLAALALTGCALALWIAPAAAGDGDDEKGPNCKLEGKPKDADTTVTQLALAAELASWGRDNQHPGALALAARIIGGATCKPNDKVKDPKGSAKAADGAKDKHALAFSAEKLVEEAKSLCGKDEAALAAIEAMQTMGARSRGATGGALDWEDCVAPEEDYEVTLHFEGGEVADVLILGDGSTDLDLIIQDENGNDVEYDYDACENAHCLWVPEWSGEFNIIVRNRGDEYNAFHLYTN